MGFFKSAQAKGDAYRAKYFAKANKCKFNTDGAVDVLYGFSDSKHEFLLVFPNRVEIHRHKVGGWVQGDSQTIPMNKITSVTYEAKGIKELLNIYTAGGAISFDSGWRAQEVKDTLQQAINTL